MTLYSCFTKLGLEIEKNIGYNVVHKLKSSGADMDFGDISQIIDVKSIKEKVRDHSLLVEKYEKLYNEVADFIPLARDAVNGRIRLPREHINFIFGKIECLYDLGCGLENFNENLIKHLQILNLGSVGIAKVYYDKTYSACEDEIEKIYRINETLIEIMEILSDKFDLNKKIEKVTVEEGFYNSQGVGKC